MTSPRSASGARQGGDDFQHLVAWNRTLRSLPPERGLVAVEVEALDVGNVDDVVIRSSAHRDEFTQVRFGVDGATPINIDYLTSFTGRGTSLLTKFHRTWLHLGGAEARPHLQLITNKIADPSDALLSRVDGRTSTLTPALRSAAPGSALSKAGTRLAEHLGVDCAELFALLRATHARSTSLAEAARCLWHGHAGGCGRRSRRWVCVDRRGLPWIRGGELGLDQAGDPPPGGSSGRPSPASDSGLRPDDVEAFVRRTGLETKTLLTVSPPDGARIAEAGEANGYATAIKQAVREELRRTSATEVHLFIAAPAGLALVLGHTWNRVAPTTVWEDLGVSRALAASGRSAKISRAT